MYKKEEGACQYFTIIHIVKKLKNGEILVYSYGILDFYASNGF